MLREICLWPSLDNFLRVYKWAVCFQLEISVNLLAGYSWVLICPGVDWKNLK